MVSRSRLILLTAGFLASVFLSFFPSIASAACCKCHPVNAPSTNVCLTDPTFDCPQIVSGSQNAAIQGYTCETDALSDTACKALNSNPSAVCTIGPAPAQTYKPPAAGTASGEAPEKFEEIKFNLNVPIPGLTFSPITTVGAGGETRLTVPYFAEYVSAVYRYLLGIVVFAAGIMVVYGGFHYILGTTLSSVSKGRQIIRDAIIGLVLAFSAYTILTVLNPATTTLDAINISYITQQPHLTSVPSDSYFNALRAEGNATIPDGLGSSGQLESSQGGSPPKYSGSGTMQSGSCELVLNQAGIPTVESLYQCGIKVANDVGIPPCYTVVAINHESYLALPNLAGHDENVTAKVGKGGSLIYARQKFLESGVTYQGKPITDAGMMNDDTIDYTKEDLGFDKRFSHGGGIMGMTIPCIAGKCYSQRDRLDPYKGIEGPTLGIREAIKASKMSATDPAAVRKVWDLYRGVDPAGRTKETLECFKKKSPMEMIIPIQFNICRGDLPLDPAGCKSAAAEMKSRGLPVPESACAPVLNCADKRMPIKKEDGKLQVR
jgi:hypothetical protein